MDPLRATFGNHHGYQVTTPLEVLIVEDRDDARRMLCRLLALDGHTPREAHDGPSGLASLLAHPPDVALIDIGLPGFDGCELARRARQNTSLDGVRLVALTGHSQPEDHRSLLAAGFDEHLVKPISMADLVRVLAPRKER
jgi:CheY-like chemotaxis protein